MQHPRHIAIDGPAGSGKSTVGEQLARCLGYLYIDTGAMYRAVAWLALQKGVNITDGPALTALAEHSGIVISHPHINDGRQYTVTVHGQDVTWDIRSAEVTRIVSIVSAHKEVRAILIAQQREMAQQHNGTVMVGRDIGAVVLPKADLKIYLTASLEERARRRYSELVERLGKGNPTLPKMEAVLADIQRRDEIDHDNMRPADDAIVIVTDNLSVAQVLEVICSYLEEPV
ncbi:MAG TPA: (d)CMP kinase [Ktedonobacteraceae bacterium]|nr:(d)CMP kinase [Ktedonobacteraceae bacterium]